MADKKTNPDRGKKAVHVLVSVDDGHAGQMENVAGALRSAGMKVAETFPISRTIAGAVAASKLAALRAVSGVAAVEEEPEFHAY